MLDRLLEMGIRKNGFSVVEVMSNCHVQFGRRNKMGDPVTMLKWLKDHAVTRENAPKMPPDSLNDKFTIGILADVDKPDYIAEYRKIRQKAKRKLRNES
jgi:2-oxoglutarate ferredoxin oxidoreductase subunit beta